MTAFSIITICRNDRDGLKRTIDSILSQTMRPAELVVVDGASTDGTAEWLARTEWPPYLAWDSEPDDGIYDAMNKGVKRLRERGLVMFLNAGDWLASPTVLEAIAASHRSHGWRWAAGSAMMVDARGEPTPEMISRPPRPLFIIGLAPMPHPAVVFTYTLLQEVGGYDPRSGIAADQHLMLRCWLSTGPFSLRMLVAHVDSSGLSRKVEPWFHPKQMRRYRLQLGRPLLGSRWADRAVTRVVIGIVAIANIIPAQLQARKLIAFVRSALVHGPR